MTRQTLPSAGRLLLILAANLIVFLLCEVGYRVWLSATTPRPDPAAQGFAIYAVGESTMVGQPYHPPISIPSLLEYMFAGRIADRTIELHNIAEAAVPLYPQALAFEQALASRNDRTPGVVIIMSGHNEAIPPGSGEGGDVSRLGQIVEKSAIVRDMLLALRRRHLIERDQSMAAYEHFLRRIIEAAQKHTLVPILATMASNISRIEPNYEHPHHDGFGGNRDDDVRRIVEQGGALEDQRRYSEARDLYLTALRGRTRGQSPLEYQAGRCEEALGNYDAARTLYWQAVDHDPRTNFGRATRPQNDLVRRLAREYGIPLVDAVSMFEAHSLHGILSSEWFIDGHHPTLGGYVLLANAYANVLSERFETPIARAVPDASAAIAAFDVNAENLRGAKIEAGNWLVATSVDHPRPRDRIALASALFRDVLAQGDDFAAFFGLGLGQVARRGALRSADVLSRACRFGRVYDLSPEDIRISAERMAALGVDADIVERVRVLGRVPQPGSAFRFR